MAASAATVARGVYSWGGLGYGYANSGLGYGPYGWGGGYGGFGNWGGFGYPGWGLGGYGLLAWQFGGLGLGGFGFPGLGYGNGVFPNNNNQGGSYLPYQNTGRQHLVNGGRPPNVPNSGRPGGNVAQGGVVNHAGNRAGGSNVAGLPSRGFMRTGPSLAAAGLAARRGVQPPPSSRPFANLASHHATAGHTASNALQNASMRTAGVSHNAAATAGGSWNHAYNGVSRPAAIHHTAARPALSNNAAGAIGGRGGVAGAVGGRGGLPTAGRGQGVAHQGAAGSFVPQYAERAGRGEPRLPQPGARRKSRACQPGPWRSQPWFAGEGACGAGLRSPGPRVLGTQRRRREP